LRNKPLYILTENLNFFYKINKRLIEKRIKAEILNPGNKIPNEPSIILTTRDEFEKYYNKDLKVNFLVYSRGENFELYLLRVIAACRIEYKNNYLSLTFSIDPGKKIGLMIFLDDYYLDSFCCFENSDFFAIIQKYIAVFEEDNPTLMKLNFKLGRGVLDITYDLVKQIYIMFQNRKDLRVCLIDEFKSSQFRLSGNTIGKKFTKDEISALILAFRLGIEVRFDNYEDIFKQLRMKKLYIRKTEKEKLENYNEPLLSLEEVVEKVLSGKLTLSNAIEIINANNV